MAAWCGRDVPGGKSPGPLWQPRSGGHAHFALVLVLAYSTFALSFLEDLAAKDTFHSGVVHRLP